MHKRQGRIKIIIT